MATKMKQQTINKLDKVLEGIGKLYDMLDKISLQQDADENAKESLHIAKVNLEEAQREIEEMIMREEYKY